MTIDEFIIKWEPELQKAKSIKEVYILLKESGKEKEFLNDMNLIDNMYIIDGWSAE